MKILLADDDSTLRMLMKELLLTTLPCEVLEANNGEEAWALLESSPQVDACILDMRMPKMGGLELISKMRGDERFKQHKVMICSGVNERQPVLEAVSLGVDGYLLKPFNGDTFQTRVRKLIEKPSTATGEALIPMKEILAKLGTAPETYLKLLDSFTSDVDEIISILRGPWGNTETRNEYAYRLASVGTSAQTLGAGILASRAAALEQAVTKNDVESKTPRLNALEIENKRVIAATAKISNDLVTAQRVVPKMVPVLKEEETSHVSEAVDVTLDFLSSDRDKGE